MGGSSPIFAIGLLMGEASSSAESVAVSSSLNVSKLFSSASASSTILKVTSGFKFFSSSSRMISKVTRLNSGS
jgi:hypothetical protein